MKQVMFPAWREQGLEAFGLCLHQWQYYFGVNWLMDTHQDIIYNIKNINCIYFYVLDLQLAFKGITGLLRYGL